MLVELVREGSELSIKGEKMIVIFKVGHWYTEEWLSGGKPEDEASETPDIEGIVDGSGEDQLGSPKTAGSNGLCGGPRGVGVSKEICCK